jgi:hypothetical protein
MEVIRPIQQFLLSPLQCTCLDDFFQNYDLEGNHIGNGDAQLNNHIEITHPSTLADAKAIVEVYRDIYKGTYPYKEMLNEDYIYSTFTDPSYYWNIFTIPSICGIPLVVGCFTIVIDLIQKRAYMRGLNIRLEYQRKVHVRELSYAMIRRFFTEHQGEVFNWYNESRTEHDVVQYLSYHIGAVPYAFLKGKDYFHNKKESDVLMVGHTNEALYERRISPTKIHHNLAGLYSRIATFHNFNDYPQIEGDVKLSIEKHHIAQNYKDCTMFIAEDKFGYNRVKIFNEETGEYLKFLHTKSVHNIEKVEFRYEDLSMMATFIAVLAQYAQTEKIEYIEITTEASNTSLIEFFLQSNYKIAGYIPAWIKSLDESGKFVDAVVFSWNTPHKKIPAPQLIPESQHLTSILYYSNIITENCKISTLYQKLSALQPVKAIF